MSKISVDLPKSLRSQIEKAAKEEGVSPSQFMAIAAAEKITALDTKAYLEKRANGGSREKLLRVLDKAPDVEPEEYDRL
jgi:metal-responsive CopG/Arc/MetJ family transcriptional regulator